MTGEYGSSHPLGSNVELSTPAAIDTELVRCSRQIDEALELASVNVEDWKLAVVAYREKKAREYLEAARTEDRIGARDAMVEVACVREKIEFEIREGMLKANGQLVQARRDQLSAAQSRASLLRVQMDFDRTSGGQ